MADQITPDGVPTWLTAVLSVATTIAGAKALGPFGRWVGKRLDVMQQLRAADRADTITRLTAELRVSREENVLLRQELGEERELRMTFAADYAVLQERVEGLSREMARDKQECDRAIAALRREVRDLRRQLERPS